VTKTFSICWMKLFLTCVVIIGVGQLLFAEYEGGEDERSRRDRSAEAAGLKVGDIAPEFELPRLTIEKGKDGNFIGKISEKKVKLSSFRGKKPVFLVFSSYT